MNARVREKHEVPVVPKESNDFDELKADVRELRAADAALGAKVDTLGEKLEVVHVSLRDKIESVHNTLRDKIDAVHDSLRDKIDSFYVTLRDKIDASHASLSDKIDKTYATLSAGQTALRDKMDANYATLSDKMEAGFRASDDKLSKLSEDVAKLYGMVKAILWAIGALTAVLTAGKALHWF